MFREVRRKANELPPEAARQLLHTARIGVLAVNGDGGYPYAVPVNFLYRESEGTIVFHGARAGHKADAVKRDGRVCFTVYGNETVKDEVWAPYVRSAVVFGKCAVIEDPAHSLECLRAFAAKYYPNAEAVEDEIAKSGRAVRMYEITIEHMSCKEVQEK